MSNALPTAALLDAIRAGIVAAFAGITVDYGKPRTVRAAPYAIVEPVSVAIGFTGKLATLTNPSQQNRFTIRLRFPFPAETTEVIALQKVTQANALIAQLQASATFASIGFLPLVESVDFTEPDDLNEQVYELSLLFSVLTQATHS